MKQSAFICDIDGTIALHENGDGTLRRGHYEYERVSEDLPNTPVIEVVRILALHLQPVFMSGREDSCREDTVEWIRKNVDPDFTIPFMRGYPLFMRETGNHERDVTLKARLLEKYVAGRWDVKFAIDDRLQVCRMWHMHGIPVFRVGDPDAVF